MTDEMHLEQAIHYIGTLDCRVKPEDKSGLFERVKAVSTHIDAFKEDSDHLSLEIRSSDMLMLDWLVGSFPVDYLERIPPAVMPTFPASAIRSVENLGNFTVEQLKSLSPHTISHVNREQLGDYMVPEKRAALFGVGGEDPVFTRMMTQFASEAQTDDPVPDVIEDDDAEAEKRKGDEGGEDDGDDGGSSTLALSTACIILILSLL